MILARRRIAKALGQQGIYMGAIAEATKQIERLRAAGSDTTTNAQPDNDNTKKETPDGNNESDHASLEC